MYGYIVIYDLIKCVIDFYSQFGVKDKKTSDLWLYEIT